MCICEISSKAALIFTLIAGTQSPRHPISQPPFCTPMNVKSFLEARTIHVCTAMNVKSKSAVAVGAGTQSSRHPISQPPFCTPMNVKSFFQDNSRLHCYEREVQVSCSNRRWHPYTRQKKSDRPSAFRARLFNDGLT